jgi:hypothetical protein
METNRGIHFVRVGTEFEQLLHNDGFVYLNGSPQCRALLGQLGLGKTGGKKEAEKEREREREKCHLCSGTKVDIVSR